MGAPKLDAVSGTEIKEQTYITRLYTVKIILSPEFLPNKMPFDVLIR